MSNPVARARLIIPRCLNGVATDDEIAELDRLLVEHPDVAGELARAARLESNLEVVLRADTSADLPASIASARPPAPRSRARRLVLAAAAGMAVAAAAVLAWSLRPGADGRGSTQQTSVAPPDARERLRFADGSTAELAPASLIETRSATATGIDLVLVRGAARFDVVPRAGRHFRIWIGSLHVDVVGTVFSVERRASGVRVSVERGAVKVISGDGELLLSPGSAEMIPLPDGVPPSSPAPAAPAARMPYKRDQPRELLGAAENARRAGRPEDALAPLRRIITQHPRDPRASYAAFILGRVLLDELGRPREAAAAFARVAALDPRTPLVPDALAREVESWSRAGEAERAQSRAREYLSRYPDGRRRQEVRRYSRME